MSFCTVINCMDGRVQLPVIMYLQQRFRVDHVDSITEPGPNLILAEQTNRDTVRSILERLSLSIVNHNSTGVAIVGHHDCAGNPASKDEQIGQLQESIRLLRERFVDIEIIGLWVSDQWEVQEVV